MKGIYFHVNIEDILQKAFCLMFHIDESGDHSQIRYILPEDDLYQLYYDKRGNKLFEISCLERRELDHAMAWFSTLGGAFSALGDTFEYCAIMAGKISQQQFLLALRLGDPNLVARCKLYMALSLIQQRKFSLAKKLIKSQCIIAKKEYERDKRLLTMCHGIWTKWKYDKKQAKINGLL
ncbi:hypothetical protein O3M35_001708 [Rhynocoris fuscipes]|uniref:Uncharacterized protein n=1 Tax=Rhynocoris fuscipes TaxID=488301 RepID=A0AAW1CUE4_9HEMI